MDEAVAREPEETGMSESQPESSESQSQSGHDEAGETEHSESETEDEEDMDSSKKPDPVIFPLVRQGDLAGVREILSSDLTSIYLLDGFDRTPLNFSTDGFGGPFSAPLATQIKMARLLLSHGALVNSRAYDLATPLHTASFCGNEKMCELLLTNGARLDLTTDGGDTPLREAGMDGSRKLDQVEVVKTLIRSVKYSVMIFLLNFNI